MKRILLPLLLAGSLAAAATLQPGEPLPPSRFKDQHEKSVTIAPDTRLIFFAAEMESSRLMAKALEALPPTALQQKNALYIADISSMPGLISTMAAVPKMQKMPYTVALVRFAKDGEHLPRKPGAVTVLTVDAGRVSAIDFARTAEQISSHLK